jgi:hypothetical protein
VKKNPPSHNPDLATALRALKNLMDDFGCPWTLIGGVAAAILGKPRFTADIDAVALVDNQLISSFIQKAKKFGLIPRLGNAEDFALKNRVVLLKHASSGIGVDISLGLLPFEIAAIKNSKRYKIGNVSFNLPRVEDLIIFKAVAHRPQDLLDIREIIKIHPRIDKKYLQKHLGEFAGILENPAILDDVLSAIKDVRKHPKSS